jgi:hypothetical protein
MSPAKALALRYESTFLEVEARSAKGRKRFEALPVIAAMGWLLLLPRSNAYNWSWPRILTWWHFAEGVCFRNVVVERNLRGAISEIL